MIDEHKAKQPMDAKERKEDGKARNEKKQLAIVLLLAIPLGILVRYFCDHAPEIVRAIVRYFQ